MTPRQAAALLRLKQLREQRAATVAAQARAAAAQAATAHDRARHAQTTHEAQRPQQEAQIYRTLLDEPRTSREVRSAAARLAQIGNLAGMLRQQTAQTATEQRQRADDLVAARTSQRAALRRVQTGQALQDALEQRRAAADEQAAEAELEEAAARGR